MWTSRIDPIRGLSRPELRTQTREEKNLFWCIAHKTTRSAHKNDARSASTHNVHKPCELDQANRAPQTPSSTPKCARHHRPSSPLGAGTSGTLGVKTKQTARERCRCAHSHRPRSHSWTKWPVCRATVSRAARRSVNIGVASTKHNIKSRQVRDKKCPAARAPHALERTRTRAASHRT